MMFCTLSDVKTLLGIPADDTTQDDKLNLMIKNTSAKIESFIGYSLARNTYTDEIQAVNNRQLLQLNHFPLQSVSSCEINGNAVTDYKLFPEYQFWGRLYRGLGWCGEYYTRGFTRDVVSGAWVVKVTYIAGYYLPGDTGYVEGNADSLPSDIYSACLEEVCYRYNAEQNGAIGIKSHSEGHISDTYTDDASTTSLSASCRKLIEKYKWVGLA